MNRSIGEKLSRVLFASLLVLTLGSDARAQSWSDHLFGNTFWTTDVFDGTTGGAGETSGQMNPGGAVNIPGGFNSPAYRNTVHTYDGGDIVVHHLSTATYTGHVASIRFRHRINRFTPTQQLPDVAYAPLIFQNNVYYRRTAYDVANQVDTWQSFDYPGLVATDFVQTHAQTGPANPDFSCGAPTMQFGYVTANRDPNGGATLTTRIGVDDWQVDVTPWPPLDPDFDLQTVWASGATHIDVTATIDWPPSNVSGSGNFWSVEEIDEMTGTASFLGVPNWSIWWSQSPVSPQSQDFWPIVFEPGHTYRIKRGVWSDCQGWTEKRKTFRME